MLKAPTSLGIVFFPAFDWSIGPTHPEREERLLYTRDQLAEEGLFDIEGISEHKPGVASREDIERTHFCFPDVDTVATRSHSVAAGGAIEAARLLVEHKRQKAFALVRPPGHHAMKVVHGSRGFCAINNEAVMIEWLREHHGVKRVAIVDTDCHHGDGTQDVYWNDPDVLFISLHQDGRTLYPGSGFPWETGGPTARGRTINIPLPPRTMDEGYLHAIEHVVLPILADFKADIVVNSAGQDNHFTDPITNMAISAQGYATLNRMLNPDIAVLEGGYSIHGALPYVNLGICLAMAGMDFSHVVEPEYDPKVLRQDPKVTEYIKALCGQLPKLYFDPQEPAEQHREMRQGNYWVRHKDVYYDTDGISETQVEAVHDCGQCRGLVRIESRSTRNPPCVGLEVPLGACGKCQDEARRLLDEARKDGEFRYIQLIDRPNKSIERFGF